ncbi:MAG: protein-export membrane protein SecD [Clostridiales bacterium GWF2_36_10]|nr:MAG: protein-export membrane protein SecD [Clostridiales bacterium GWF2_36_10]HAN21964.1 protein translocase subunit SecD [Clostridiales bacterium]
MNYQRAVSVSRFILVLLIISLLLSIAVFGFKVGSVSQKGIFEEGAITLGLDLEGGSSITYQAQTEETGEELKRGMDSVLQVMRQRLDSQGLTEALAYLVGDDMVTVEIPSVSDPAKAAETLMATAVLTFKNYEKETVLEGSDVESASWKYDIIDDSGLNKYYVDLQLTDAGSVKFAEATKIAASKASSGQNIIYIYMDEQVISAPSVDAKYADKGLNEGNAVISGSFTEESAKALAGQINAGALEYKLNSVEQSTVGATLGEKSLVTSLKAGAIGLALVMIFMIAYYRVPGLMASISLTAYMALFMLALIITKANLTLPGIAGIILSIGMAVDANVVIFERVKEELRLGKSAKAAVKAGQHRALAAVIDSNVTTLIAAGVLILLGAGTIKGFGITLLIGVSISMITAIYVTRALLYLGIGLGLSDIKLYGVKKESVKNA